MNFRDTVEECRRAKKSAVSHPFKSQNIVGEVGGYEDFPRIQGTIFIRLTIALK